MAFIEQMIREDVNYLCKVLSEDGRGIQTLVGELLDGFEKYLDDCNKENAAPNKNVRSTRNVTINSTINSNIPPERIKVKIEKFSTASSTSVPVSFINSDGTNNVTGKNILFILLN